MSIRQALRAVVLAALVFSFVPAHGKRTTHERLRVRNTFQSPEEVVGYYVRRDASGFVWSGLLDIERRNFTTWKTRPEHDSFLIARSFKVDKGRVGKNQASVTVKYEITGMADGHGTRFPAPPPPRKQVVFNLVRVKGKWKINRPLPKELSPVVMESLFPLK